MSEKKYEIANKIQISPEFEKRAVELASKIGGSSPAKIEELKNTMAGFKDAIDKMNKGEMDYSTMRSLYG